MARMQQLMLLLLPCVVMGYSMMARPSLAHRAGAGASMKLADDGILGVGVIGAGRIGIVHLEALAQCESAKAVVGRCWARTRATAARCLRHALASLSVHSDHLQSYRLKG